MKLELHHPKALALVLLAIAAVTAVGLLFAEGDGKDVTFTPIPVEETLPTVSEEELEKALSIVRKSGIVKEINVNQDWDYELVSAEKLEGLEGVSFDAVWEDPVVSSGPWALDVCQGTRKLMTFAQWSNITRLEILVDMENEEVAGFVPMSGDTEAEQPILQAGLHGEKSVKVYGLASGALIFDGTKDELDEDNMCPAGKEDEKGH